MDKLSLFLSGKINEYMEQRNGNNQHYTPSESKWEFKYCITGHPANSNFYEIIDFLHFNMSDDHA